MQEAEEKAKRILEEQEAKRHQLKQQIAHSRSHQVQKRRDEKTAQLLEEKDFTEFWKARNDELAIADNMEKEEIKSREAALKKYQLSQAELRKQLAEEDYIKDMQLATSSNALIDHKEREFYSYAERCIKEWQDQGKNVKPLILELKNYKKKVL